MSSGNVAGRVISCPEPISDSAARRAIRPDSVEMTELRLPK